MVIASYTYRFILNKKDKVLFNWKPQEADLCYSETKAVNSDNVSPGVTFTQCKQEIVEYQYKEMKLLIHHMTFFS